MVTMKRRLPSLALTAALWAVFPAQAEDCTFHALTDIAIGKEMMITELSVVNDARDDGPDGQWSLGGLMRAMAPTAEDAGGFVKAWLHTWQVNGKVNGFPLEARLDITKVIISPW